MPKSKTLAATVDLKRTMLASGLAFAIAAAALFMATTVSRAQDEGPTVSLDELLKPGPLPEVAVGPADAKVTIVEYFSMTCPHCAEFANKVYPEIKKKYVDSGKVRFIFREYPHNNRAHAASMLARCAGDDKVVPMIEGLFETQSQWAFQKDNPAFLGALFEIAKQSGFTQESFNKCLGDQQLLENIAAVHKRANDAFNITRIPAIFINGKKLVGEATLENVEKLVEPLLPKS